MHTSFGSKHTRARTALVAAQSSALGRQLFFALTQLEHEFRTTMQAALEQVDLDVRQYTTLAYIVGGHRPTQLDLGHILHLDASKLSRLRKDLPLAGYSYDRPCQKIDVHEH